MVWILLYHSSLRFSFAPFMMFKNIGYGGVDICFLTSGIGCYYSLNKNPDIFAFFKRRFLRIGPTYLCYIFLWFIYKGITGTLNVQMMIGNIFGIQNFTGLGNAFDWYISALLLFYLLTPALKSFVDKANIQYAIVGFVLLFVLKYMQNIYSSYLIK